MVSEQAQRSIDSIFSKAASKNLLLDQTCDVIEISHLPASAPTEIVSAPYTQLFLLTISSYLFRLTTIFHVSKDKQAEAYYTRNGEGNDFLEVFSEQGNMCCGAMNRELGNHFLHLGMSTPSVLDSACTPFLNELKSNHISRHTIRINCAFSIQATLCLRAYANLDFKVDTHAPEEEYGTIELF